MVTSIIPQDIIATEILTRLPSKSLLRFRSVCRTWNNLISDPFFITQHFDRSVEREAMHITLMFNTSPPTVYSIDPENLDTTVPHDINAYPPRLTSFRYGIGSCDGLVCARVGLETVSVWHASTRTSMAFRYAALPRHPSSFGFFYDSASRDYKLVSVRYSKERHCSVAIVHSADYTECRWIESIPYKMIVDQPGVVVNGSVHWLALTCSQDQSSHEEFIFALNPTCQELEEMSKVIPIPTNAKAGLGCVSLAQLGGSLSIVFTYSKRTEIWLMKEYGVEPWSMYFRIPTDNLYFLTRPLRVVPLYITKKGDLILQINNKKLFMFDKRRRGLKSISIKYPQPGPGDNWIFSAVTLLDSLVDIRNGHGGGKPFLGRQIKRESNLYNCTGKRITKSRGSSLYNCTGKRITESIGSDSANDSTNPGSEFRKMIDARFVEVAFNTSDLKLYKLLEECNMDLQAAANKFSVQVLRSLFSEFKSHLKREHGLRLPHISGDATTENLITENMESDFASIRQMQLENGSVSSTPERLNHVALPIPEFGASMSYAPKQQSPEYRFYQLIRNTQLGWYEYGDVAARLAILRGSSKVAPHLKPEIEATLERFARYVNARSDSAKDLGVASKLSVMDTNDASVSSTPERVNNDVRGAPHNQNQQLPELGEGQCTKAKSTQVPRADGNLPPESPPSKD